MKRSVCALMTAAAVVGCQAPEMGGRNMMTAHLPAHNMSKDSRDLAQMPASAQMGAAKQDMKYDPAVQQVGYNHGWGASQNRNFRERVAAAVPSHGGMAPGGGPVQYPGMGGMGGDMGGPMGGPGCAADGMGMAGGLGPRFISGRTQVRFTKPRGMHIAWQNAQGDVGGGFTATQLETPARYNFMQARIYRLKLTRLENRPGLELYPTLEVYPGNVKVDAFLAHNAVPVELTEEDLDQVQGGNFVTKVIYLPDPKFQELAIAGVETLVSTRLDPGVDPVGEAHRRGAILAVLRIGSVDLEMPHSPPLANQSQGAPQADMALKAVPGQAPVMPSTLPNVIQAAPSNMATAPTTGMKK